MHTGVSPVDRCSFSNYSALFFSAMETFLTDYCPREILRFAHIIRYVLTLLAFMGLWYETKRSI